MNAARYVTSMIDAFDRYGDRTALVSADRGIGYRELLAVTYRLARALRTQGVERGSGVVCLVTNTPEALYLRFACHLLGARYVAVQLNALTEDLEHILADADPAVVVFDPRGTPPDQPVPLVAERAGVRLVLALGPAAAATDLLALAATQPATPIAVAAEDGDVAGICYTSGTTGTPKGVACTFAALAAASEASARTAAGLPLPDGLRFVATTSIAYAVGDLAVQMLVLGIAVELHEVFDAGAFWAAVRRSSPVATFLYPPQLYQLLDHPAAPTGPGSNLALVVYGSSPIAPRRLRQAIELLGPIFLQGYAQTEVTSVTILTPEDHLAAVTDRPQLLASVGRPVPGCTISIVDPEGRDRAPGEVGEVCVRSASVMTGYWRQPELTAQVVRDGRLHTGDLGYLDDDGYLYLVGRLRDMIIVNGRNCHAAPVEAVLTGHPQVRQAAVVGVPSDETGEAVHAFVVRAPGRPTGATGPGSQAELVDAEQLRALVTDQLGVLRAPAAVTFVDDIPLTAAGKPDKKALRASLDATPAGAR
ncbi:AMP-binding protein [Micromonospora sp. NPDC049282]|uniref:AMP-binding protein n=1 Tax=Micromonospora sp. NPDC049282 TaxID=3364269 RepID=UPI003715898E